ncbi:UNVERIFIED_CONTAM: hypothetical protein Sradi_4302600 [Sesamum radiatum]|uniref:Uncharacterized protein n=1 Tax=Sesamum radiatum TaxID=300843 RepID=A0AAW2NMT8_SESRA
MPPEGSCLGCWPFSPLGLRGLSAIVPCPWVSSSWGGYFFLNFELVLDITRDPFARPTATTETPPMESCMLAYPGRLLFNSGLIPGGSALFSVFLYSSFAWEIFFYAYEPCLKYGTSLESLGLLWPRTCPGEVLGPRCFAKGQLMS